MQQRDDYPTNFSKAEEDGRIIFLDSSITEAREATVCLLTDGDEGLSSALDKAQGDAAIQGAPQYLIIRINP